MNPDNRILEDLIRQVVAAVHPLQIILFGSAARGEMRPGSDLDTLVVMPEGAHRRRTAQQLYRSINNLTLPFDIVVATPADLERHRDNIGLIYRTILKEGKIIYAET